MAGKSSFPFAEIVDWRKAKGKNHSETARMIGHDLGTVYNRYIRSCADEMLSDIQDKAKELGLRLPSSARPVLDLNAHAELQEWFTEHLNQSIDGDEWVVYTYLNHIVILCSYNSDAASEELGEVPKTEAGDVNWAAMASMAMRADIVRMLDAMGVEGI